DLLLPDISYLLGLKKRIAGMVLTHGHEDHFGALPFILPQLPKFPIFGTPFTAALANEKLREFNLKYFVTPTPFEQTLNIDNFSVSFIRVTHSVPDASNLFIKTPVGNFYHGSDFKFDPTPWDGKQTEVEKIEKLASSGVTCLFSDCLGAEKKGFTASERPLYDNFLGEMKKASGKFIVTTYSSHISRLNQILKAAANLDKKVCFVGRSLNKSFEVAKKLGLLQLEDRMRVEVEDLKQYKDEKMVLLVAGSQGQEESAMTRIVNGEHRNIKLKKLDTIVFSADIIPGNEVLVNSLIDSIAKKGIRVLYSQISDRLHVSGHGSISDLLKMISLTKPKKLLPIGGNFRHMAAYKSMAMDLGYRENDIFLIEDGQEVIFQEDRAYLGKKIAVKKIYVDNITGGEIENFVLRDRQRILEGGVIVILAQIDGAKGELVGNLDLIARGFILEDKRIIDRITQELKRSLRRKDKNGMITNWVYVRRLVGEISERIIYRTLRRRPLVLPIVIEV
ncbi:MAG: ribonuclease J, partial [bacterium]|nr:ribonuclease J [bacterium]